MPMDINDQVMKAAAIMESYRMSREHQMSVVKILMAAGVDHCLNEQQRLRDETSARIERAFN